LSEIVDFEGDVIDAYGTGFVRFSHVPARVLLR